MALVDSVSHKRSLDDLTGTQRKRFKTSELPLTSGQRSSIDALLHTFKKKGEFDVLRKKVWSGFNDDVRRCCPCSKCLQGLQRI